jgi:hypothetical protein
MPDNIMGHSNGVRLIYNDAINHRIVETIKQRMKHWILLERDRYVILVELQYQLVSHIKSINNRCKIRTI